MQYSQKRNRWEANGPYDLIGWDIQGIEVDGDMLIVRAVSKKNGETRTVYATLEAVPTSMHEYYHRE